MASVFTKIVKGEIPGTIVHQDEHCAAILDIHPQAPHHVLIFPRKEIRSIDAASPEDQMLLGHLMLVAAKIARNLGVSGKGYRLVVNTGADAGQTVDHFHLHLLAGKSM